MNRVILAALLLLFPPVVFAQTAPPANLVTIEQDLKKLDVLGSVLYFAAHPDDENTRLLAYLAQEKHYRTGYLSLTRGDGGQNLLGSEQGELLGLIRTQELLAARRVDGAEQFFSRANDFGFSKGPDETLKIWDHEKVLSDAVWVIRKFRPDVIICRFPTTGEGGHGHHTSSAIIAQEAFTAAADPKRFPEQLAFVKPWQAKRLLWNTFSFGNNNTIRPDQFKVDVGVYNRIIGKGYGELAAESRSNHKTQGFGSAAQRGESFEYFKTILGDAPKADLMDGVNTSWKRTGKGGADIETAVEDIQKNFKVNDPAVSVSALVKLLDKVEQVDDEYWRVQKTEEIKQLIAACAGLWFEAYVAEPTYAAGDQMSIRSEVISRFGLNISLNGLTLLQHADNVPADEDKIAHYDLSLNNSGKLIPANQLQSYSNNCIAAKITQPYWLETAHSLGSFNIPNQNDVGNPENPDLAGIDFEFVIDGKPIHYYRRLVYKYTDPVRGEVYQPLEITPPVTATIQSKDYVFNSDAPHQVQVKLKSFTKSSGTVAIKPIDGWKISPEKFNFEDKAKGDEWTVTYTISPTDNKPKTTVLQIVTTANGKAFSVGLQRIRYDHVPNITLFPPAQAKLIDVALKTAGKKIAYIAGAGDLVPDALKQVGYDVHQLTENEILNGDLSIYDAIITGVRAWNINERLIYERQKLMDYVKNGGNLVVQYNNNAGILVKQIGPYPFRPVNERVTDENAPVTILDSKSPLLNFPNKITQADFNGWIQERGLYFVTDIDPQYKTVLQMNDPGEAPNNGSLISCDYGKGRFVYTSLAFFRQLPAGVPGAYRLFVNLLSNPKNQSAN